MSGRDRLLKNEGWKAITDEDGDVANRYHYTDSWGNFVLSCPSANIGKPCIPNRYAYTGREWDADLDLYHYRARWYDPETKRFTQEDPVFESANKYKYVDNNPIVYFDPTGKAAALIIVVAIGTAVAFYAYEKSKKGGDGLDKTQKGFDSRNWEKATKDEKGMEDYQNAGKEIAEGTRDLIDAVGLVNDGWGGLVAWFVNLFFKEEEDPCK